MTTNINHPAPDISLQKARHLAVQLFGVNGELSDLASERDRNFRIDAGHAAWTFKIVNASEPAGESEFQAALLRHLEAVPPGIAVPLLRDSLAGGALAKYVDGAEASHAVRMVSWLPGAPLAETKRDAALLRSLGAALGRLDTALRGFIHPGALRRLDWDIRRAGDSRARLQAVDDPADRALLARLIDRFDAEIAPRLAGLRAQVIHNDANDWNVLVDPDRPGEVSGIIDFGDAVHSVLIAEVAVAGAYGALDTEDPVAAIGEIAAGFHAHYPLMEEEIDVLFDLVIMRLVMSVTISAARRQRVGDNPYLAISEAPAWRLLRRLANMNRRFVIAILRHACGFETVPGARDIAAWLQRNKTMFAPLVKPHPATLKKALAPFGNAADPMTMASAAAKSDLASELWQSYADAHRIGLGIGPWGEARTVYTGDMFRSRLIEGERRDRHLGLDLFMPAGTELYTPLDATVRSVEIEEDLLGYGGLLALEHHPQGCPPFVTLWGHLAHDVLERLKPGQKLEAGAFIATMGAPAENGNWVPHLHFQISADVTLAARDILGVGEGRYLAVWSELFPDPSDLACIPAETFAHIGRSRDEIVSVRHQTLLRNLSISYSEPIKFVRGEGVWLIDDRGRAYLDCFNNVCHLGHAHPDVVAALSRQAAILNTNTRYLHDTIIDYAERLTATLPKELCVAAFTCSGSEANSLMIRMARTHTKRQDAIVLDWAYHGTTPELIELSPYKYKRRGGQGRPSHVFEATIPDSYRAPADWAPEEHGQRFAQSIAEQIAAMKRAGRMPAFFLAESIPSVAGQVFLPEGYLHEVYRLVRDAGGICVADEVQVGFGRVGTHWWAFETQGVTPDIVTMGKPIGNGHPMAALVTTREIASSFNNGMEYFNTFGGNPVSCAVGLAVLDVIERDGLRRNAAEIGSYLLTRLRELQRRYEPVGDVRGMGLFLGVELVEDRQSKQPATALARKICDGVRERGVLIGTEGPHDNVLKMRPPMIFNRKHADHLIDVLDDAIQDALKNGT